jgi:hypothetical protein
MQFEWLVRPAPVGARFVGQVPEPESSLLPCAAPLYAGGMSIVIPGIAITYPTRFTGTETGRGEVLWNECDHAAHSGRRMSAEPITLRSP